MFVYQPLDTMNGDIINYGYSAPLLIAVGDEAYSPKEAVAYAEESGLAQIAAENGRHIVLTRAFNPLLRLFRVSLIKKVFGSLTYEQTEPVSTYSFKEAVHLTEKQ